MNIGIFPLPAALRRVALVTGLTLCAPAAHAVLYGVDDNSEQLVTLDVATGTAMPVGGPLGYNFVRSLTFVHDSLYAVDVRDDLLLTIDRTTGAATAVGPLGGPPLASLGSVGALAFDAANGLLFGADEATLINRLVVIDVATGAGTVIGDILDSGGVTAVGAPGYRDVRGLAYADGTLFGLDSETDELLTIDPLTGTATAVGALGGGLDKVEALTFDPATQTLYGVDNLSDELVSIDRNTGAATVIGSVGPAGLGIAGIAGAPVLAAGPRTWVLLAAGLAMLALAASRRRRPTALA